MKTAIIAALLALTPAAAFAGGCSSTQAMSCADGTVYDHTSGACVPTTT